jgi:hypothetical protein
MKARIAVVLLVVVVVAGLVFLRLPREEAVAADVDPAAHASGDAQSASAAKGDDAVASATPTSTEAPADSSPSNAPTQATAQTTKLVGLQPLTADQEQRLEAFVDVNAKDSERVRDFEMLSDNEAQDPDWSEMTERRIEDALRRHGARYTALHAGPVHCTQSICRMLATGGFNSEAPDADWQRLVGYVMDDPPLRNAFMDMSTVVSADAKGIMYVTYLVRRTDLH